MNKTQLTKGLNKLGKIVEENIIDLENLTHDDIYSIFPIADDIEIEEDSLSFYLGDYTGRITRKDIPNMKNIIGVFGLVVDVVITKKQEIVIAANIIVDFEDVQGNKRSTDIDIKEIIIKSEEVITEETETYEVHEVSKEFGYKLVEHTEIEGMFIYKEDNGMYIAIFNDIDMNYIEEAKTFELARQWLVGEITSDELYERNNEIKKSEQQ